MKDALLYNEIAQHLKLLERNFDFQSSYVFVPENKIKSRIAWKDIVYFQIDNNDVTLYEWNGKCYSWKTNLIKIESFIQNMPVSVSCMFYKIKRNTIINIQRIKHVHFENLKIEMEFMNHTKSIDVPKIKILKELTGHHFPII